MNINALHHIKAGTKTWRKRSFRSCIFLKVSTKKLSALLCFLLNGHATYKFCWSRNKWSIKFSWGFRVGGRVCAGSLPQSSLRKNVWFQAIRVSKICFLSVTKHYFFWRIEKNNWWKENQKSSKIWSWNCSASKLALVRKVACLF